jgi:hypothetical protein
MARNVIWKPQAVQQLHAFSSERQARAHAIVDAITQNPNAGWHSGMTTHDGRPVQLRTFPGYTVEVEFYRWGWFRRNLTIYIHAVRPMDWPSQTDYEERTKP